METMMEALRVEERTSTRILDFDGEFVDQHFSVQIWLLANACFVWIGLDSTAVSLGSMSTAVKTKYDPLPLASSLIGGGNEMEQQMAQRLVLRTGRQVFVSCNLPDDDMELGAFIERAIIKRLNQESR
ncbi:hypothetical protein Ae201684_015191 [Aphanomyces euteiches]|uniref:Proteasome assembly chaperone 4 n=1 Tax=Aphanomyces euteiches TaxID=100861 RepID=A0A6G0WHC5_9STRA|nr:hypothetical protein Ae201684_015191 [Aphanomyces euteiches]KAH9133591.1 hypothetical protein AeRB84_020372 [Aphanomyces euteiches]